MPECRQKNRLLPKTAKAPVHFPVFPCHGTMVQAIPKTPMWTDRPAPKTAIHGMPIMEPRQRIPDRKAQETIHPPIPTITAPQATHPLLLEVPQHLISQGLSFFNGLAETLKSPEATRQLVDSIVAVDKETGETNIKIPVADKQIVLQMFSLLGKLMQ